MSKSPLVSIGLPVFNGERFLTACLDSLRAQTYANLEIIISDNASTDGTLDICERYARMDSRIRVLHSPQNLGSAWNHNRVRQIASGKYFKWCGADDVIAQEFVQACVEVLETTEDAVLAFPLSIVIDDTGREIDRTRDQLPLSSPDVVVRFSALLCSWPATQNPYYGVVRRTAMERVRPLGSFLANDRCVVAELSLLGRFLQVQRYLMFRRKHVEHQRRTRVLEQRLLIPQDDRDFRAREWNVLRENLRSVARASLDAATKQRLTVATMSWVFTRRMDFVSECWEYAHAAARSSIERLRTIFGNRPNAASSS